MMKFAPRELTFVAKLIAVGKVRQKIPVRHGSISRAVLRSLSIHDASRAILPIIAHSATPLVRFGRGAMSRDGDALSDAPHAPLGLRHDCFAGASHEEALARLEYLVETGLRCGVVVGPKGAGKTLALRSFVAQPSTAR